MDLGLHGKKALITGSSGGLGLATALVLATEGADVAINGRDPARLERAAVSLRGTSKGKVVALTGDVGQAAVPGHLVDEAVVALGGLDILVTNAGGPPPGSFEGFSDEDWAKAIDLCLLAHVRLIRAALPALKASAAASVLTVTSISVKAPIAGLILSNSVRAATVGLTKSLALELGPQGIRVNSILPAYTETDRITQLMKNRAEKGNTSVEEERVKLAADSPLGRIATPDEFARAAAFLVSPAASYLTGVMLPVDGGSYKGTL